MNESGIKALFIINRYHPKQNGESDNNKTTLIDHLESHKFHNLIKGNGQDILEVDIIKGIEGRINEIFNILVMI